ncbi:FtsX-like permease family protein [Fulvivirga sp. RKSG066]|uniref:ABC transporter permease n=1 Tax=Fulvivirga aurantia TaxID=2529383 RepID=UPI0012BBFD89|nr:ABC transporter permease [Fulvivirga aurantia]MTI21403.1 FtsX-like permease family protein [Fulvivirga aurantia]
MIKNFLNITLRNLRKNKWFSLINIIGLTIGITSSLVIYLYINQEVSFDDFHEGGDRIFRVTRSTQDADGLDYNASVPYPMIGALHTDLNHIESATQIHNDYNPLITFDNEKFILDRVVFADSNFFDVFSFKTVSGNPKEALGQPNLALITASTANLLFNDTSPIGKKVKVRNKLDVEIVGIVADPPVSSHIQFDMLISYPSFTEEYFGLPIDEWSLSAEGYSYVKLQEDIERAQAEAQFEVVVNKYFEEHQRSNKRFYLQPLADIHFDKKWNNEAVSAKALWALGIIGAFILIIGAVNFINLTTALSVKKSKEVGVRKTLGAARGQLIRYYLGETFIVTFLSGLLSIALAERLLPIFNQFFDKKLAFSALHDFDVLLFVLALILVVTLAAGVYPAIVLSGFNPVKALKSNIHSQSSSSLFLRKGLIVVQFFISQVLIIATLVVASQMNYFVEKPLGFEKEAIVNVSIDDSSEETTSRFRDQLLANENIKSVSFALGSPMSDDTFETHYFLASKGRDSRLETQMKPADFYYNEVYGLKLLHGRWFTPAEDKLAIQIFKEEAPGSQIPYILNETAVKKLGFSNPEDAIGQMITTGLGDFTAPIVGVVKDFHSNSLHNAVVPVVITKFPQFHYNAGIKISTNNTSDALAHIQKVHQNLFPDNLYEYDFMDESVREFYEAEQQTFNLFKLFSGISIFVSCLGLLGLISFIVNQRTKEVGVRKVLGANIFSIIFLFSKDFILLVVIAFLLAAPVAWYVMSDWLNDFAYRIDMHVWFFVVAILISAIITFMTIGYQSLRAALENPVKALKDE